MNDEVTFQRVIDRGEEERIRPNYTEEFMKTSLGPLVKKVAGVDTFNGNSESLTRHTMGTLLQEPWVIEVRQDMFRKALFGHEGEQIQTQLQELNNVESMTYHLDDSLASLETLDLVVEGLEPLLEQIGAISTARGIEKYRNNEKYKDAMRIVRYPSRAEIETIYVELTGEIRTSEGRYGEAFELVHAHRESRTGTYARLDEVLLRGVSQEGKECSISLRNVSKDETTRRIIGLFPDTFGLLPLGKEDKIFEGSHTLRAQYTPDIKTVQIDYPQGLVNYAQGKSQNETSYTPRLASIIRRSLTRREEDIEDRIKKEAVTCDTVSQSSIRFSLKYNPQLQRMKNAFEGLEDKFTQEMYIKGLQKLIQRYTDSYCDFQKNVVDDLRFMSSLREGLEDVQDLLEFPKISNKRGVLRLEDMLHPLFTLQDRENTVANSIYTDEDSRIYCIGGATGGGKTSILSGVGLNVILAQFGLPVFGRGEQEMSVFDNIFFYTGVENKGSDVSTHQYELRALHDILSKANPRSLVLLDEPAKGAQGPEAEENLKAVLDGFKRIGCTTMLTTHFPKVEEYVQNLSGGVCYHIGEERFKLQEGVSEGSYALQLAQREGMDPNGIDSLLAQRGF